MHSKAKAHGAMVFIHVAWGLSFIFSKHALNSGFTPMALAFVRYLLTALIYVPMLLKTEKKLKIQKGDWLSLFFSALFGITLYYYFEYTGITLTSTVNASLILAAIPILTMLFETALFHLPLTARKIGGAVLSIVGVGLIVATGADSGTHSLKGDLMILGASLAWVGYLIISAKLRKRYTSLSMNTLQALFGLATLLPLALAEPVNLAAIPLSGWVAVLLLAAVCSALCYWLYGNAIHVLTPLSAAIYINLIPLVTIIGGVFFLSEPFGPLQAAGGLLIIISIFIVSIPQNKSN